jgi:hypothetical protein
MRRSRHNMNKKLDRPIENFPELPGYFSRLMLEQFNGSQLILLIQTYGALQVEARLNGEPTEVGFVQQ